MKAFQLADRLVIAVYGATSRFPRSELFGLCSQMRRSAVSTAANIVEGSARRTRREYVRFLEIALSSARELGYFVELSVRLGYLDDSSGSRLRVLQGRTAAALASLIRSLRT